MIHLLTNFFLAALPQATTDDLFPDRVENPSVTITHRVECDSIDLQAFWAQGERWRVIQAAQDMPDGSKQAIGEKLADAALAMEASKWNAKLASLAALEIPESSTLPGDARLVLRWSPTGLLWGVAAAFQWNPPADRKDQLEWLSHHTVKRSVRVPKAEKPHDTLEFAPGVLEAKPAALTTWRALHFESALTPRTLATTRGTPTVGQFAVDRNAEQGIFSSELPAKTGSVLVIAKSTETDDVWLWFEEKSQGD